MTQPRRRIAAAVIAIGALALLPACSSVNQKWHHDCVVDSKERLLDQGTSGDKRVYTSCGSFTVEDSFAGGYSSQDVYNRLVEGETYSIRTGDFRVGLLSKFPNVIEVEQ